MYRGVGCDSLSTCNITDLKKSNHRYFCSQENEAEELFQQIKRIKSGKYVVADENKTDLMKNLEAENAKLAYQALHLERVIQLHLKLWLLNINVTC